MALTSSFLDYNPSGGYRPTSPIRPTNSLRPASSIAPTFGDISSRKGIQQGIQGQLSNLGAQAGAAAQQRGGEYGDLTGGYRGLLDSGYSPEEKSAIQQSTLGAIGGAYGGAQDQAQRRLARTGNAAGYGSLLTGLARGKSSAMASQSLENQKAFADEKLRRKMAGLEGIANLYGVDTSFLSSMLGQQGQMIGQGVDTYNIASQKKGLFSQFLGALGGGLGAGIGSGIGAGIGGGIGKHI